MRPTPIQPRTGGARPRLQRGFTLFETILVIGILTLVSLGIMAIQPQVFKTQTAGRDQFVGLELMRACAERLLAVRRATGFGSVTNSLCNGMGGVGGFASNPTVTLADANRQLHHDMQHRHLHGHASSSPSPRPRRPR